MKEKLYAKIARKLEAMQSCDDEWYDKHEESILELVKNYLPSGSGIDSDTSFDIANSNPNKLIFTFGYHHMDENGYYDGWTEHKAIVTPSLAVGIDIKITGSNRNDVKDYLYQVFEYAINQDVE